MARTPPQTSAAKWERMAQGFYPPDGAGEIPLRFIFVYILYLSGFQVRPYVYLSAAMTCGPGPVGWVRWHTVHSVSVPL
jgi:hypothetical protein